MSVFTFDRRPTLREPVLVICLDGWVNAGSAATLIANTLGGERIASGDPDLLFDYRVTRPILDFVEGIMTRLVWPQLSLRHLSAGVTDLLVLAGTEPNWNWRRLGKRALPPGSGVRGSSANLPWRRAVGMAPHQANPDHCNRL